MTYIVDVVYLNNLRSNKLKPLRVCCTFTRQPFADNTMTKFHYKPTSSGRGFPKCWKSLGHEREFLQNPKVDHIVYTRPSLDLILKHLTPVQDLIPCFCHMACTLIDKFHMRLRFPVAPFLLFFVHCVGYFSHFQTRALSPDHSIFLDRPNYATSRVQILKLIPESSSQVLLYFILHGFKYSFSTLFQSTFPYTERLSFISTDYNE